MNSINKPLIWVHPPQQVDRESSFLDEAFNNKENVRPKKVPKRRFTTAEPPGRTPNREVRMLGEDLRGMNIGSDYRINSNQPFTRQQKRRMTVDEPVVKAPPAASKHKPKASPKKSAQTDRDWMPPPSSAPPKKRKAAAKGGNSKSQNVATASETSPSVAAPSERPQTEDAGSFEPAAEEAERIEPAAVEVHQRVEPAAVEVRQLAVVLAQPQNFVVPSFSQIMRFYNQRGDSEEAMRDPKFYYCHFPDMASFQHCADGITFCQLARGTGIIQLAANRTRKFSFTENHTINLFLITGKLQVTVTPEPSDDGVPTVVEMTLLDYLCLKSHVSYQLANVHQTEAICFFWRESTASTGEKIYFAEPEL